MSKYTEDPILANLNNATAKEELEANEFAVNSFLDSDTNKQCYHICIGWTTILSTWSVNSYNVFLDNIRKNNNCKYKFIVDLVEPCCWVYEDGYFYYTVWDYGEWFDSYKIKMNAQLLTRLEAINEIVTDSF